MMAVNESATKESTMKVSTTKQVRYMGCPLVARPRHP
jgi:hypothetical protein